MLAFRGYWRRLVALFLINLYGHLEKLLISDKSHLKHGKTHLFAKGLFSGLVGLGEKFEFFEVPDIVFQSFIFRVFFVVSRKLSILPLRAREEPSIAMLFMPLLGKIWDFLNCHSAAFLQHSYLCY
jgi:hypothetical protein